MNTASKPVSVKHTTSPAALEVIWQWLSYASWMWVIGLLGFLTAAVLQHFLVGNNETYGMSEGIIYLVVATAIVTPIAFFVDRTYSRIEPTEKHGFAAVVLALHSVVAFLAFVGVSIAALVALVSMLTEVSMEYLRIICVHYFQQQHELDLQEHHCFLVITLQNVLLVDIYLFMILNELLRMVRRYHYTMRIVVKKYLIFIIQTLQIKY